VFPTWAATLLKVLLALEPRVEIAVIQTTMMSASITAYSTAVGPSSFFKKLTTAWDHLRMSHSERGSGKEAEDRTRGDAGKNCSSHDSRNQIPLSVAVGNARRRSGGLPREEALRVAAEVSHCVERGKGRPKGKLLLAVPERDPAAQE
jgi:hypothetical protein